MCYKHKGFVLCFESEHGTAQHHTVARHNNTTDRQRERERLLFLGNAGMGGCWMVLRVQMPEMLLMPGSACARPHTHKYKSHLYSQKHSEKQYGLIVVLFNNSLLCMCVAADIISAVEFNHSGELLATGDRGGRIVIFQQEQEVRWITVHYAEQLKGGA